MDEHSDFSRLLVIVLIAIGAWFWYDHATLSSKITADEKTSSSQQSQASATENVPAIQSGSPESSTPSASQQTSPLQKCIAQDDAKYWKIDYLLVQACEKFGYSYEDYQKGICQLPYPDMNQTMLVRRQQKLSAQQTCERTYGSL